MNISTRFQGLERRRIVSSSRRILVISAAAFTVVAMPAIVNGALVGQPPGWLLDLSLSEVNFALITLVAALALQLLIGRTGLISIGSAGFYALGGAVGGLVGVEWEMPFELVLVTSVVAGAVVGAVVGLPSLALKGLYALLATLAFHFIALYLFLEYESHRFGVTGILYPQVSVFGFELADDEAWYTFLAVIAVLTFLAINNLAVGRQGRALITVRDQEIAARASGINVGVMKVKIYALSSALTAAAGTLYVYYLSAATVELFTLDLAIQLIAIIVIGGTASARGAVLGVAIWTMLPKLIESASQSVGQQQGEMAFWLEANQSAFTSIIFGLAIVVMMVLRPDGMAGLFGGLMNDLVDKMGGRDDERKSRG